MNCTLGSIVMAIVSASTSRRGSSESSGAADPGGLGSGSSPAIDRTSGRLS